MDQFFTALVTLAIVSMVTVDISMACSCIGVHPQTYFCSADFVIKAKVKGADMEYSKTLLENGKTRRVPFMRKYRIVINKVLKEPLGFQNVTQDYVFTPPNDALCGTYLRPDAKYLLTGSIRDQKMQISLCDLQMEWSKLPVRMRKGFNFQYEKNCKCQIMTNHRIGYDMFESNGDHCSYNRGADLGQCYYKHSLCKMLPTQDRKSGVESHKCKWTRPKVLKSCEKKARDEAFREP